MHHHDRAAASAAATDAHGEVAERIDRPDRAKHIKALIARRARDAAGCDSAGQLAQQIGVREWLIKRHESAAFDHSPNLEHVLTGPIEYAQTILTEVGQVRGLSVAPFPRVEHGDDHAARVHSITVETTDVLRGITAALRDGAITRAEAVPLLNEVREAQRALAECEAYLVQVVRGER